MAALKSGAEICHKLQKENDKNNNMNLLIVQYEFLALRVKPRNECMAVVMTPGLVSSSFLTKSGLLLFKFMN